MSEAEAYNPYAPPAAPVVSSAEEAGLKHRSLWVMFLLVIVTLGIYYPVWFFRRRPGLNRLNSQRKLSLWPLLLFAGYFVAQFALTILAGDQTPARAWGASVGAILTVAQLGVGLLMIVQCFIIKDIVEDHAQGPLGDDAEPGLFRPQVKLSGLMTFFFSIFYLQHAINKYAVDAQR